MSGQIRISKLYLVVLYSQKPRSTSPPVIFQTVSLERLSGNFERAPFRGPKSPHEGAKWHNFRRSALPRKARSDPFRYFPDSLSRKLADQARLPAPRYRIGVRAYDSGL